MDIGGVRNARFGACEIYKFYKKMANAEDLRKKPMSNIAKTCPTNIVKGSTATYEAHGTHKRGEVKGPK